MHRWQTEHAAQLLNPQPDQRVLDIATGTGLAEFPSVQLWQLEDLLPKLRPVLRRPSMSDPPQVCHLGTVFNLDRFAGQSPYSAPGRYADRLAALPDDLGSLCAASRNVIAHYRAELPDLPEERRGEIDSRWLEAILALDQQRHPADLDQPRPAADRVAGCCRDHSLLVVGALRQRGVPARNRIGFAHYFTPGWAADHVIVEFWHQERWRRADPELGRGFPFDVHDLRAGADAPFETAAEAWLGWRAGRRDLSTYGVQGGPAALSGPDFVRNYVIFEVAHRYGDEMLLWDGWGATEETPQLSLIDEVAQLLVRADAGDNTAEADLWSRYHEDDQLHPGNLVMTYSPYGLPPSSTDLRNGNPEPAHKHS